MACDRNPVRSGIAESLKAIADNSRILGQRPLHDLVAENYRDAAVRQIDLPARSSVVFVRESVVADLVPVRTTLELVSDYGAVRVIEPEDQAPHVVDIEIMGLTVPCAV